ncbi:MAG: hypothetical protein KAS13_05965 [Candidatus Omnitrophica bacterium]|nr:hypothetical protein [Candidatus Omnitrophota bacterium]
MRKKKLYPIVAIVFAVSFLCANSLLFAQSVVLNETEIKEDESAVKILFSTNRSIPVECYDLSVPPQVIIDFMGEIYTNKPEIMMVNKGVVKQMRVIRGTKKSQDLDDSFYSVDFIIVDLKESMRYDFDQGLTTSVLVVSKPGKIIDANKARKEAAKLVEKPLPVSAPAKEASSVIVAKSTPLSMDDKEYEMPVKPVKSQEIKEVTKAQKKERIAKSKKGRVKKVKKQKPMAEKSEAKGKTTIGKMKTGIKNFFTFGKGKKEGVEPKQKRRAQKPVTEVKEVEVKEVKAVAPTPPASKNSKRTFFSKRRKPKERSTVQKAKKPQKAKKVKPVSKAMKSNSEVDGYINAISLAQTIANEKIDELQAANKNLSIAADNLKKADSAKRTIGQRIENNNTKQELLKADFNESFKLATYAKSSANATWMEYSDAKEKLSLFLKNNADAENLEKAQTLYEQKKTAIAQAIKSAESVKEESDAKLALYEQAVQEGNDLLLEADDQKKNLGQEQMQYNIAEEEVFTKRQELASAENGVQKAERDYQQYEIDKSDAQYKEALFNIDQTLALEAEKEQRRKEAERLSRIKDQKAEQMRVQQAMKDKEEAQLAALKQIQKNEEAEEKQFLQRRKEKAEPKRRRVKPMAKPAAVPEVFQRRTEVLSTAVELRNSGLEMQRQGDFDSAVKYYQQALISDPKYSTVHNDLGILYEQKGLNDKAKMEYLAALKINPHYVRAHSNLALLYEKSGDNNKAYYHWKQRVQLGLEDDPWTHKAKKRMELLEQQRK